MKLRSAIATKLVNQGYLRYSKEFRAAYQRELRKRPGVREKEREKWRAWAKSKSSSYHSQRIRDWRLANPGRWQALMKRASKNGLHRRFYDKHKERIKPIKREQLKRYYKRIDPTYGLTKLKREVIKGNRTAKELVDECSRALAVVNERCNERQRKSTVGKCRM